MTYELYTFGELQNHMKDLEKMLRDERVFLSERQLDMNRAILSYLNELPTEMFCSHSLKET